MKVVFWVMGAVGLVIVGGIIFMAVRLSRPTEPNNQTPIASVQQPARETTGNNPAPSTNTPAPSQPAAPASPPAADSVSQPAPQTTPEPAQEAAPEATPAPAPEPTPAPAPALEPAPEASTEPAPQNHVDNPPPAGDNAAQPPASQTTPEPAPQEQNPPDNPPPAGDNAAQAPAPEAKPAEPADKPQDNQADSKSDFDKQAFDAAIKNADDPKAVEHALKLGLGETKLQAFLFLVSCGQFFIEDDEGKFDANAGKEAFTAAVLNITPEMIKKARQLTIGTDGDSISGAVFCLLSSARGALRPGGKFSAADFNAAFGNLDKAKVDKATALMGAKADFALTKLLRVSGAFRDDKGSFDAAAFNNRFNALKEADFTGNEDEKAALFDNLMKP